jgi:hypothetical protein
MRCRSCILMVATLVGCTDSALVPPPGGGERERDNRLTVTGRVCTSDPKDVVFPLKVLFVIDTSGSMNVSDPVSPSQADPTRQTGRARAIRDLVDRYVKLDVDLTNVSTCSTGLPGCEKGSASCASCGPPGTAICVGPDCCDKPPPLCKGVPACPAGPNGTCVPLCTADADCQNTGGGRCQNGVCSRLLDPGVEFGIMRFGSAKQVLTRNADGLEGFTNDPRELVTAIPQVSNGGSVTDYEGALAMAYEVISADVRRMKDRNAVALGRTRYMVILLSDGRPDPQVNDEDEWDKVPCHTQADLLGVGVNPLDCDNDPLLAAARQALQEYNLPTRVLRRVQEIVGLKVLHRLADVRVHTAYLAGAEEASVEDQSTYLLRQMAHVGRGTFLHFETHKAIDFVRVGFSSLKRVFTLQNLIVTNLSARPVAGAVQLDSDADGLADGQERQAGTNTRRVDTDQDGYSDTLEHFYRGSGWDALDPGDADCPVLQDKNGDGRPDDTDGDGLLDCEERILGTNRTLVDSDADGIPDGLEVRFGTNPVAQDALDDPDVDGMSTGDEIRLHTDPHADDATHRSKISYRYDVKLQGTGIETVAKTCIRDRDCPGGKDCRDGYCRCVADSGCSSLTSCTSSADCLRADERCNAGRCESGWSCRELSSGEERACAATKHVACYSFAVENIALVTPLASGREEKEDGWNRIRLFFGENPLDSPGGSASFKAACVLARYTETEDGRSNRHPLDGHIAVPPWAWQDLSSLGRRYRAASGYAGPPCGAARCDQRDACLDPGRGLCLATSCVCPDGTAGSLATCR